MGVAEKLLPVLAVGVFVTKKPGAIALQRIFVFEKCTLSHWVKFDIAAFAPDYAGIFASVVYVILEIKFISNGNFITDASS